MPLYDYACPHCGKKFEEFRSLKERATAPCPECGKDAEKQISGFFTNSSSSTPSPGRGCPPSGGGG